MTQCTYVNGDRGAGVCKFEESEYDVRTKVAKKLFKHG